MISKPVIKHNKKEEEPFEMKIIEVHDDYLIVSSETGEKQQVHLHERVEKHNIHEGDIAIITPYPTGYLITHTKPTITPKRLSSEEEQLELQRQEKELEDIGWGMY